MKVNQHIGYEWMIIWYTMVRGNTLITVLFAPVLACYVTDNELLAVRLLFHISHQDLYIFKTQFCFTESNPFYQ